MSRTSLSRELRDVERRYRERERMPWVYEFVDRREKNVVCMESKKFELINAHSPVIMLPCL